MRLWPVHAVGAVVASSRADAVGEPAVHTARHHCAKGVKRRSIAASPDPSGVARKLS